jgi:Ser/Thr protein kinase RdoA (MazF antagonist)
MEGKPKLNNLISKWDIGEIKSVAGIYYTGQVFLIKTAGNRKYVLKQKKDFGKIEPECLLLTTLKAMMLPVPAPVPARDGKFYVRSEDKYFCLYPYISGGVTQHYYRPGAEERAGVYGRTIAALHAGMKRYGLPSGFESMDLIQEVYLNALPVILRNSPSAEAVLAARAAEEFKEAWLRLYKDIPVQLIHKDMHPVNMLLDSSNRLVGIIDFDSAAIGPRVFDPCYCCTYMLINGYEEHEKRSKWFALLRALKQGYESVQSLTGAEREGFWCGMIAAAFILDAAFFKVNNTRLAEKTRQVISWILDNRHRITGAILKGDMF